MASFLTPDFLAVDLARHLTLKNLEQDSRADA
jgi:hypothetical protein